MNRVLKLIASALVIAVVVVAGHRLGYEGGAQLGASQSHHLRDAGLVLVSYALQP